MTTIRFNSILIRASIPSTWNYFKFIGRVVWDWVFPPVFDAFFVGIVQDDTQEGCIIGDMEGVDADSSDRLNGF